MGITDITDRLGGKQVKQMADLVDDLWGERKKILKVVDLVWDNRDEIMGVVKFVGDNKDKIDDVVGRLPTLIGQAGQGLEAAGVGAARASALLLGDDGDGPQQLTDEAADLLDRCQQQLFEVTTMVGELGQGLSFIQIPNRLDDGAQRLIDVADDLGGVAVRFRRLGAQLADAGVDMADVGTKLGASGSTLQSFVSDGPAPRRKTAAPKATAKQRTKKSDDGIWGSAAAKVLAEKQKQAAAEQSAERRRVAKRAADQKRAAKKIADAAKEVARRRDAATSIVPGKRSAPKKAAPKKPAAKKATQRKPTPKKPPARQRSTGTQQGGSIGPRTMKQIND